MWVTAKGLRRWVMGAAALLLAVVIGFFLYGRNRYRHIARDLPARLGVNIQQTAMGFSYSQSSQGHTLFTLKASKEFQMKSGHVLLHNVNITLYGPPGSGRRDHIYGSDFDYDQGRGIAISHGKVQIQLEGLGAQGTTQGSAAAGPHAIQVQTSGLTFAQKTGQASTSQPVYFELPNASGSAVGAQYNAKTGVLVLQTQVHITTNSKAKTATIGAAHATVDREKMQALLTEATLEYEAEQGSADQATVDFRKDGTAEKIDARGHVRMATSQGASDAGARAEAATGVILLNEKSQPLRAEFGGGVTFAEAKPSEQMQGSAEAATLVFAVAPGLKGATELRHAEFLDNVKFAQEAAGIKVRGPVARELHAQKLDVEFAPTAAGQPMEASKAIANGSPVMTMRQAAGKGSRPGLAQSTRISGDELVATLAAGNALRELDGQGHTQIESTSSDGARETSQGDVLRATFRVQPAPVKSRTGMPARVAPGQQPGGAEYGRRSKQSGPTMQTVLETAVQDGNVVLTEIPANRATTGSVAGEPLTAWAEHAEYRAADEALTLTGHPRIREAETMQMSAQQIVYHRTTQDAEGDGDVKATYTQGEPGAAGRSAAIPEMGGQGPVHVIAERAAMRHATGKAVFYGTAQERARMWQGPDSLLAPTIEIDRNPDVLKAWGDRAKPEVLANFLSAMGAKHEEALVSIRSRRMDYSDTSRQGDFQGDVTAEHGDETIHADDALVMLAPENKASSQRTGKRSSEIERVVATGHVVITQPGRRGDGARLVYTADDGKYVLTGTPETLPRLWDQMHGTTTGAALIFNSQNDSVEVSGGKSSAVTMTRAPR